MEKHICIPILISLLSCIATGASAQNSFEDMKRRMTEQFESFKAEKENEFEQYRSKVNREFADHMRLAWKKFHSEPAIPPPPSPEPPEPVVAPPQEKPVDEPVPFKNVTRLPDVPPAPAPLIPVVRPTDPLEQPQRPSPVPLRPTGREISFDIYGNQCRVAYDEALMFNLRGIDEKSVADAWQKLAADESVELIEQCIDLGRQMKLSDWGYLRMIERLSEAVFPGRGNEARLLQMFILAQSGYKVRIGRCDDKLIIMVPGKETIYNYKFIPIKGVNYYVTDPSVGSGSMYVYDREFPGEQMFSLELRSQPVLPVKQAAPRHFTSQFNSAIDLDVVLNENLIDFYNEYPLSGEWAVNARASLSGNVKEQLYPLLRSAISGKNTREAANILLHFVQTAFDYQTDGEQFGYERSFFPDETFFYPYSDCEDRAILYSVLVRDLLGLDVMFVYYPGHLATAVRFDEDIPGDHFVVDGEKYTVCDPTYINSNVGMAMPSFKTTPAELIRI